LVPWSNLLHGNLVLFSISFFKNDSMLFILGDLFEGVLIVLLIYMVWYFMFFNSIHSSWLI